MTSSRSTSELLSDLLKDVSRSFYLTLRVLPGVVRKPIGLAYLLARATDTIADTSVITPSLRLSLLEGFQRRFQGDTNDVRLNCMIQSGEGITDGERSLLRRIDEVFQAVARLPVDDVRDIHQVLGEITGGQILDLKRFETGTDILHRVRALATPAEVDDYTFRVAGCVGEFWSRICRRHLFPAAILPTGEAEWILNAIRFGKGLQWVNILRDLPKDLGNGRCYIPSSRLAEVGLSPAALVDPKAWLQFEPVYRELCSGALDHLGAGWKYTLEIPRRQVRLRLACAWPILLGRRTLELVQAGNPLDPSHRIKVSGLEVQQILRKTIVLYPFRKRWENLFASP